MTVYRFGPDYSGYVIEATKSGNDYCVDFKVFEVVGADGRTDAPLFGKKESSGNPAADRHTLDRSEAEVFLHGHVKWDGCSNLHFDEQDRVMLHFCSKQQAGDIGRLLERLYDIAAELMGDHWDGEP
jgi:hypothetical protein